LVVLPVRRRIDSLESRLSSLRADAKLTSAVERSRGADGPPVSTPGIVPGFGDGDEIRAETLTRAYALPGGVRDMPPYGEPADQAADQAAERGALQLSGPADAQPRAYAPPTEDGPTSGPGGRDWFDEQPPAEGTGAHRLIDDRDSDADDGEDRGTVFTQRTTPIPAELIRSLDESEPDAPRPQDALVDDLADEPAGDDPLAAALPVRPGPPQPPAIRPEPPQPDRVRPVAATFEPVALAKNGTTATSEVDTPAEPAALPSHRSTVAELPSRTGLAGPKVSVEPERVPNALPKRVPAKPRHQYHPFGVETVTPAVSMGTVPADGGERLRSLFEPIVPAESGQTELPPPPHRLQSTSGTSASSPASGSGGSGSRPSAPGPFGPGSAMPLPGGGSPSPEFTVKASVTALRYCTSESPQFGRTVAEVWFRTAADAERVGFRPVG
jgi:hypothetical protein